MTDTHQTEPISGYPHVLIVSGMSGAGKSSAAKVLEDLGYTVVDNLPLALLGDVVDHHGAVEAPGPLAVGIDVRGGAPIDELRALITEMLRGGVRVLLLFLDADDATLIRRYDEVRRPHPVETPTVPESIAAERALMSDIKEAADIVIDTSRLNVHELRDRLTE
ncbi:MAG: RNase adaptor protein RapZ, partial [Acidimicrobiia bacterium]|nr:RNase adaptor protein RapZ [Acidimicrobiia bacterium]